MQKMKNTLGTLANILLWGIILVSALFSFTTLVTKQDGTLANIAGYSPLTVLSDSMKPEFKSGDLIIIKECEEEELKEGEIITFNSIIDNQYVLNTHRIVKIEGEGTERRYTTQGDNNEIEDQHLIAGGDIVGRYITRVPCMGPIMEFLSSSMGFLLVIVLPMLLFLLYQIYNLIMIALEIKKTNRMETEMAMQEELVQKDLEVSQLQAEAEAALAEAKRLKEEAEATLAEAKQSQTE